MNKKLVVWMMMVMLLVTFVSAVPPVQQDTGARNHLEIVYPKTTHFVKTSAGLDLHFHILNSTGHQLNSSDVNCTVHVYDSENNHLQVTQLTQDSNGVDLKCPLNSTVTNTIDEYTYIVYCDGYNGQTESGWLSTGFSITPNGMPKDQYTTDFSLGIIILLPMLFAAFLIFSAFSLGEDHSVLRLFFFMLGSLMILLSFHFALLTVINVYGFVELQEVIGSTTYWLTWTLAAIIMYFLIYIIWKSIDTAGQTKIQKLEY